MNLRTELQRLVVSAIPGTDVAVVYKRVIRYMKSRARKGKRSCDLKYIRWLSVGQREALKQRLRDEKISVVQHSGLRPYVELKWGEE